MMFFHFYFLEFLNNEDGVYFRSTTFSVLKSWRENKKKIQDSAQITAHFYELVIYIKSYITKS